MLEMVLEMFTVWFLCQHSILLLLFNYIMSFSCVSLFLAMMVNLHDIDFKRN